MKLLIKLLAILVLGAVLLLVAGYFLAPPAADKAVSEGSKYAFGVPATIGSIDASPGVSRTGFGFQDYSLASPAGFDEPLLTIGKFDVGIGTASVLGATKEVKSFTLENVELTIVQKGLSTSGNNLAPVIQHLMGMGSGAESEEDATDADEGANPGPKLRVGEVKVAGVAGRIIVRDAGPLAVDERFEIPAYVTDLSDKMGEDGMTVAEIAGLLVTDLKDRALDAAGPYVPAPALERLDALLVGGIDGGVGGAIDAGEAMVEDAVEAGKAKASEAIEGVKDGVEEGKKALEGKIKKGADELLKGGGKALDGILGGSKGGK